MKKTSIILLIFLISKITYSQNGILPIIDMHLHAIDELWSETRICFPEPCDKSPTEIKEISELLPKTIEKNG